MLENNLELRKCDLGAERDERGPNEVNSQEEGSAVDGRRVYEQDPILRPDSQRSQCLRKTSRMHRHFGCGEVQFARVIDAEDYGR